MSESVEQARRLPRAIPSRIPLEPILWRCLCGQFNNVKDWRCIACGWSRR